MFDDLVILFSSILFVFFTIVFRYQLNSLFKSHPPACFSTLALKIMKLLTKIYRNIPSAFIALSRLDPSCQLINPSSKSLARSFFISDVKLLEPSLIHVSTAPNSISFSEDGSAIMQLLQLSTGETQRSFLMTNFRSITTLALTSIIMAPIPTTLLATFYGGSITNLLPLIASLFYGVSLQLVLIVLKNYMKLLI